LMRSSETAMKLLEEAVVDGEFYLVRDRDVEDTSENLEVLQKRYEGNFFVWDRYHIENYLLNEEAIYSVLADDEDIPTPASVAQIERQLRALADGRKEEVLARYVEAEFNSTLRQRIRINVREGVKRSLDKATEKRLQRTSELLGRNAVDSIYGRVSAELDKKWDTKWKELCIGRDVLEAYHNSYVEDFLGYSVFRNRVARKIQEMKCVPEAIKKVRSAVTADLPRETTLG
jgi:hypothetical protein